MSYAITALGWTLIHFCWQATAIALLYRLADAAVSSAHSHVRSKAHSHVRYVAALAALLSMLVAAGVTLAWETARSASDRIYQSAWHDTWDVAALRASTPLTTVGEPAGTVYDPGTPILTAARNAALAELRQDMRGAIPWLDAMWLLGVLCLSVRTVGGWWLIQRLRNTSLARVPAYAHESFGRLSVRFGIRRPIDLRISTRISSPLAMGIWRSVVLLPASALTSLSPEQLEVVLAHELAHIRRADYLWNMLQTMIETLFFFHPAVWWVSRNLREQRELCCDDAALECCTDPLTYATALLCLEEERGSRLRLAMALNGHQSGGLRTRIARILDEAPQGRRDVAPFSLLGACAMLGLVLFSAPRLFADLYPIDTTTKDQTSTPMLAATVVAAPHASKAAGDPSDDGNGTGSGKGSGSGNAKTSGAGRAACTRQDSSSAECASSGPGSTAAAASSSATVMVSSAGVIVAQTPPAPPVARVASPAPVARVAAAPAVLAITPNPENYMRAMTLVLAAPAPHAMPQSADAEKNTAKGDYIDQMRAAGYNADLDKYMAMKIQGITPEYARSMAGTGFGKPTADELIAMKIHGVSPSEVTELKAAGIDPGSYQDLITYRIFKVTPEFVTGMKAAGFNNISAKKLVELRIQGVTPDFAKATKQQWPDATVDEMVQLRIFNINGTFIASAKRHGLEPLTIEKLVRLRISGVLDDESPDSEKNK
jgi:beta-lactamase regulating signal transducer with metallopeptidase domain